MKKILIINGHPNKESLNHSLCEAYKKGATAAGCEVQEIVISDLDFNPNLQYGYKKRMELEPDLLDAWQKIQWSNHIVWVHPVWWGGLPAITKGFIDRLFLPGMAFSYKENSVFWNKLLKGRSAHIITTLDQPGWYYRLFFGRPSINQLKKSVLQFCGISPVKHTYIGIVKTASEKQIENWINKAYNLGKKLK